MCTDRCLYTFPTKRGKSSAFFCSFAARRLRVKAPNKRRTSVTACEIASGGRQKVNSNK